MQRQVILVQGYPRSGNVWLARLLGQVYNSPVQGLPGQEGGSLAAEGFNRPGNHRIIQAHWMPENWVGFTDEEIRNKKVILIHRHPLDVAVSASHFWRISLEDTVQNMVSGDWPFAGFLPWHNFYNVWLDMCGDKVSYELLSLSPTSELRRLTGIDDVEMAIFDQSFLIKRGMIECNPRCNPRDSIYTKKEQLHSMRKGIVGDWKNHFVDDGLMKFALDNFGGMMKRLGYDW